MNYTTVKTIVDISDDLSKRISILSDRVIALEALANKPSEFEDLTPIPCCFDCEPFFGKCTDCQNKVECIDILCEKCEFRDDCNCGYV